MPTGKCPLGGERSDSGAKTLFKRVANGTAERKKVIGTDIVSN
jgi:hypothetical protein